MNIGKKAASYKGTRPNVPASLMLAIARRIWRKRSRG
jgi:hypothetical protein